MIALWMTYATLVALFACIAASTAERALRLTKRPARAVWIGAMTFVCLIPLATTRRAPTATELVTATTASVIRAKDNPEFGRVVADAPAPSVATVTPGSTLAALDRPLVIAWIAGSLLWSLMLVVSAVTITRRRRSWTASTVDGVPVLASRDVGPAVVGLLGTQIVIPAWVVTLAPEQRALVLAHEQEHARARDPLLLAAGAATLVAMPWNAALWYALSRLRLAVEADCDGRVLRAHPDVRAYSSLLVDVTERNMRSAMHLAALGDSRSQLARRLTLLTARVPRHLAVRVLGAALLSLFCVAIACETPTPAPISREAGASARARPVAPALPDSHAAKAHDSTTDIEEALLALDARPDSMLTPSDIRKLAKLVRARRASSRPGAGRTTPVAEAQDVRTHAKIPACAAPAGIPLDRLRDLARHLHPETFGPAKPARAVVGLLFDAQCALVADGVMQRASDELTVDTTLTRLFPNTYHGAFSVSGIAEAEGSGPSAGGTWIVWAVPPAPQ